MLDDVAKRTEGTGADLIIGPPDSSLIGYSQDMPEGIVRVVRQQPHVAIATAVLMQPIGELNIITGINLAEFDQMSGGFEYLSGGPFQQPDDLIVDEIYARSNKVHVGSVVNLGKPWRVCGIVEPGKLSRTFAELQTVQQRYSAENQISRIYVKVDDRGNIPAVQSELEKSLPTYKIYRMEELVSLMSVNNVPMLRQFTDVIIGVGLAIGFLVVFLSMYTAVVERTREIGVLKALGAGPGYILDILMRETILLSVFGTIAGVLMTYGVQALLVAFVPTFSMEIVYGWWPFAAILAVIGSLIGALYPGFKAARQDAIEALSYD
jgi:putative ABC transport system permease protein